MGVGSHRPAIAYPVHAHHRLPYRCPRPPGCLPPQGVVYAAAWRGLEVAVKHILLQPGAPGAANEQLRVGWGRPAR